MSNDVLFWTQIGSIVTFVLAILFLYRLLVEQKDATIQLLKESNESLKERLVEAGAQAPDVLAKVLSERAKLLEAELEKLMQSSGSNRDQIQAKERELDQARSEIEHMRERVERAKALLDAFICPHCGAPMIRKDSASELYETDDGHEYDIKHEFTEFECGYSVANGIPHSPCKAKKKSSRTSP